MLTFTAPDGHDAVPHSRPGGGYVATLATGLRESRGWQDANVETYLATVLPR
jgi:hypothetical protein